MGNFINSRLRKQDAVVWKFAGSDNEGQVTVSSPIGMKVRIEEITRETLDSKGNTVTTFMSINVSSDVPVGSLVWLGKKSALPTTVTGILQVIDRDNIPDIKGRNFDRWVGVQRFGDRQPVIAS